MTPKSPASRPIRRGFAAEIGPKFAAESVDFAACKRLADLFKMCREPARPPSCRTHRARRRRLVPHREGVAAHDAPPPPDAPRLADRALGLLPIGSARAADSPHAAADAAFKAKVAPLLAKYCVNCHAGAKPKGELDLARYGDTASILAARKTWESVLEVVESGEMPPKGKPRPDQDESATVVGWLQSQLTSVDCATIGDPGRVTLRRLNRAEYNNTVKDLTDVDLRPADDFPSDDVGYGFDNIGDVLSIPPILFEKYMAAAETIAGTAIVLDEPDRGKLTAFKAAGAARHARAPSSTPTGGSSPRPARSRSTFEAPADGEYYLVVKGYGDQAGKEPVKMEIRVDGKAVKLFDVTADREASPAGSRSARRSRPASGRSPSPSSTTTTTPTTRTPTSATAT